MRQNRELKAKLAELETVHKTKTKVTSAASESKNNNVKDKRQASCRKARDVISALRRDQQNDGDVGQILQEVEAGQRPDWKDVADRSPIYKSNWAQSKSLVVRDGVLERHWESAGGRTKTAQIILPRSKVKEVLTELHGGPSGGHLGVNKTMDKIRQRYYWLHSMSDVERWCQQCDTCAASRGP
jgi:hypothetical protein